MIQLNNFLLEKLKLDKNIKIEEPKSYKEQVQEVIDLAKEKGLKVVFRDRKTDTGDFCFFVYDKSVKPGYLVGYDGDWKGTNKPGDYNFEYCLNKTIKYIEDYNK